MGQVILAPQTIAHEVLRRFKNNLGFAGALKHEYDEKFAVNGAKIGDKLTLRYPVKFVATPGAPLTEQDVEEKSVDLVLNKHYHVGFSFPMKDLTLTIDRFSERYLKSAAVSLANVVDVEMLNLAYQGVSSFVGVPGTIPTTLKTYNQAGAWLDKMGVPYDDERTCVISPDMQTEALTAGQLFHHDASEIRKQFKKGRMGTYGGFEFVMDQNIRTHTTGPFGGTAVISGNDQIGASILTRAWTAAAAPRLTKGDIVQFAGCYAVNPISGDQYQDLRPWTLAANFSSLADGTGTITLTEPLITSGPYKNCSASPADGALISIFGKAQADHAAIANKATPQGLAFHKEFVALAMAPFEKPSGVDFAARSYDKETGMALNIVRDFNTSAYKMVTRVDILFGGVIRRPEFAVRIQS